MYIFTTFYYFCKWIYKDYILGAVNSEMNRPNLSIWSKGPKYSKSTILDFFKHVRFYCQMLIIQSIWTVFHFFLRIRIKIINELNLNSLYSTIQTQKPVKNQCLSPDCFRISSSYSRLYFENYLLKICDSTFKGSGLWLLPVIQKILKVRRFQ